MKKIMMIFMALLISAALFADVSGSVSSTTDYDVDGEGVTETIGTSISAGALTVANTFVLSHSFAEGADNSEDVFDWEGAIDYALTEAITLGVSSSYGIDSVDVIPLTLSGSWAIADFFSISASYTNDNLNPPDGEEVESGSFTFGATFSF